jgi:anti-sigma-K factor RskA
MTSIRAHHGRRSRRRDRDAAVHTLIGAYALDALDGPERAAVERHLRHCPDCAAEVAGLRAATVRLADTTAQQPPADLRGRVLAAAARTRQDDPPRRPATTDQAGQPEFRRGARWPRWVAAAAAVAVLVAGAGAAGWAVQRHRVDQVRRQAAAAQQRDAQRQARLDALLAAPDATVLSRTMPDGTHLRMIMSAGLDRAAVYLTDLAPTPAGHTYQLWLMTGAAAVSEGVLPAGSRSYSAVLTGLRGRDAFGVSIEPAPHGSPAPTHTYAVMALT